MKKNQLKVIALVLGGMTIAWMGNRNFDATILLFCGSLITLCVTGISTSKSKEARRKLRDKI